ncbi:LuxR family transcriptional regulator [Streptomyces sp. AS58]|uniref:DNA-binding response regulator n=1 Tax=Streptomyces cadmiisoli TaxID=2184053 RepID=A0A2Z4JEC4_9ACTN|nr:MULTISPECIES: response regulator transcription factor [Streptomyces]AWW43148.1 DNA-binding response regulator [Streptomyces cadmiisoli]KOV51978.1 LuxR family transcriptional regulator [Streptomyces sp. AS58]
MPPDRIFVHVRTSDPISEAGIVAALKTRAEIWITDGGQTTPGTVALIVADEMNDEALTLLRTVRGKGMQQVIAVVSELDDAGLMLAVESGIAGLVRRREATADRLVQVIESVHRGAGVVPPDLLGRLLKQVSQVQQQILAPRGLRFNGLTDRESDVLRLVAAGLDTREIAQRLSYSERTVKNVLHDVTHRFQLRNRSHAVAYAIREGLI